MSRWGWLTGTLAGTAALGIAIAPTPSRRTPAPAEAGPLGTVPSEPEAVDLLPADPHEGDLPATGLPMGEVSDPFRAPLAWVWRPGCSLEPGRWVPASTPPAPPPPPPLPPPPGPLVSFHHSEIELKHREVPTWPAGVRAEADVRCMAEITVDAAGVPGGVLEVSDCPAAFHAAAKRSVLRWRWYPPRQGRDRVGAETTIPVVFRWR